MLPTTASQDGSASELDDYQCETLSNYTDSDDDTSPTNRNPPPPPGDDTSPATAVVTEASCSASVGECDSNAVEHDDIMDYARETIAPSSPPPTVVRFTSPPGGDADNLLSACPLVDHSLLYHHVTVVTRRRPLNPIRGYLYTVDPATRTVALVDSDSTLTLIPGDSVAAITPTPNQPRSDSASVDAMLKRNRGDAPTDSVDSVRRKALIGWLMANRVTASVACDGSTILACYNELCITPPYLTDDDYHCSNMIVLSRMLRICKSMPDPK